MLDYMVAYVSKTGNTKQLAKEIFRSLPGTSKDICDLEEETVKEAAVYFVGFWVNRGSCEMKVIDFLSGLAGKKIVLFGTCGMGSEPAYYQKIENNISVWIPEECDYLGTFLCQGKMPMQVRNKYEDMRKRAQGNEMKEQQVDLMLQNFDEALLHPNAEDLKDVQNFIRDCLSHIDK